MQLGAPLGKEKRSLELILATSFSIVVAHTGLEPVISALRGQRVSRLHQCAVVEWNYRCPNSAVASCAGGEGVSYLA